ncbi:MAG: hypothetical protein WBQ73_01240, partial [Candidatus Babeliales bacterium]
AFDGIKKIVGDRSYEHLYDHQCPYSVMSIAGSYTKTFSPEDIAAYFFGSNIITFSGSRVSDRGKFDVLADYFGLPLDFKSTVCFDPSVSNIVIDLYSYYDLGCVCPDSYISFRTAAVRTKWNLGLSECIGSEGIFDYPAGYMSRQLISRSQMVPDVTTAFKGAYYVGDMQPLAYGKIDGPRTEAGLSDIYVELGKTCLSKDRYNLGVHVLLGIPTGTRATSEWLFEPMIGNGKHWELGFGAYGYIDVCRSPCGEGIWSVYGGFVLSHLFSSEQCRSYDFRCSGPGSRYLLVEEMGSPVVGECTFDELADTPVEHQYHGKVMPGINVSTLRSEIAISLQADFTLECCYRSDNCWDIDVGYNFWARTAEHLVCRDRFPENCFAVKGDAQIYGFSPIHIPLNATQSNATVRRAQGSGSASQQFTNANADNAAIARFQGSDLSQTLSGSNITGITISAVSGSRQAILLKDKDIDAVSGLARSAVTHSFFGAASYRYQYEGDTDLYVQIGAKIEVDGTGERQKSVFDQWGVWFKCGVWY